jgi:hypothetical protein
VEKTFPFFPIDLLTFFVPYKSGCVNLDAFLMASLPPLTFLNDQGNELVRRTGRIAEITTFSKPGRRVMAS